ncbi:glycoside hydrolase family 38 N-terminal domain-containing protein [Vagococcus elongatus]|nr:hypothetical protein [Vagococcus elongatus]
MSKVKNIFVIHHSHFDLGYTHHQELITEWQINYIDQAIALCKLSLKNKNVAPFRWTVEATYPLKLWLDDASEDQISELKLLVKNKLISIAALPFHSTPLNDAYLIKKMLETKKEIEKKIEMKITTAINHDINGQPWTFADQLIDSGVDFYLTGENIHFGAIPFKRPKAFYWKSESDRKILSFLGEHYSLFSQFLNTNKRDVHLMKEGLENYLSHLEENDYDKNYIVLTATTPPLLDNNPPDMSLLSLVTDFNKMFDEYKISFITPELLRDFLLKSERELEIKSGDWTDYWNFGAGSTPKELKANRDALKNLKYANFFEALCPVDSEQYKRVKEKALENSLVFNEHTWGAAESITEPFSRMTLSQQHKKATYAYDALAQSAFVLNRAVDNYFKQNMQLEKINSISFTNLSNFPITYVPSVAADLLATSPYLSSYKSNQYFENKTDNLLYGASLTLQPYETNFVSVNEFKEPITKNIELPAGGTLITKHYEIKFNEEVTEITEIKHKLTDKLLFKKEKYGFFDLVIETIDGKKDNPHRSTFFPRDIELANFSVSVWNHNWHANRQVYCRQPELKIFEKNGSIVVTSKESSDLENVNYFEKILTFDSNTGEINIEVSVQSSSYLKPISHYVTIPTQLNEDWEMFFESADTIVALDEDQLGNVSKDWVTIGKSAAFKDAERGLYYGSKDAPLLQTNGFRFGKESIEIERSEKPLFLAWLYNNYWDTNFKSTDEGLNTYSFSIKPFAEYDVMEQIKVGESSQKPVVMSWHEADDISLQPMLIQSNTIIILSIELIDDDHIQFFMKNVGDVKDEIIVQFNELKLLGCFSTDVLGTKLSTLSHTSDSFRIGIEPRFFGYVKLKISYQLN